MVVGQIKFNSRWTAQLARRKRTEKPLRVQSIFARDFKPIWVVQSFLLKFFDFLFPEIVLTIAGFRTEKRGVRVVTNVERECGGRDDVD